MKQGINKRRRAMALGLLCGCCLAIGADAPETPKVSSFAPAEDLAAQVDYFVGRTAEALADKASYDEVKQSQVFKDSNTLAVVALALAMHDQDHKMKKAAPALLVASQALAGDYTDFDKATIALSSIKKVLAGEVADGSEPTWQQVASMSALMKQVPVIYLPLKRGATDERRFKKQAALTAAQAATLAAIAQAAMFDTDHATEDQIPQWQKFCAGFRDSAGAVNSAAHAGDPAKAAAAIQAMQKSCDDCHAVFHKE